MSKVGKVSLAIIGIVVAIIILVLSNIRKINATVIDVKQDVILFEDVTGNIWSCRDNKNTYKVGQNVILTLNDKGTDFIEDDEIYGVK